jgi:PhnB protein
MFTTAVKSPTKGAFMPNTHIQPYLFFGGRCEEAIEFYAKALGAQVEMLMHHRDSPDPHPPGLLQPGFEDKVMHATIRIGGAILMASDGCDDKSRFDGFRLSLAVPTEADARRAFAGLSDGGEVQMPLTKTFWSPCFGMVTDRFGVGWMVSVVAE